VTAPSRRRQPPGPVTPIPVGGGGDQLAPPQPFEYDPNILASTDPTEVPPPPSPPAGVSEDHHLVGEPVAAKGEEVELSPEEQVMFASLLTCGRRSKVIRLFDHTVVVQTLCGDDDLRIALYVKEYKDSIGEQRAYQIGVSAAGIRSIDGQPLVQTLYENADPDAMFDEKIVKVAQMYPTVINKLYRAVMDAEKEFVELATKLGKLDG
jgi:hypothetical protein